MKGLIIAITVIVWFVALYFGYIKVMRHFFHNGQKPDVTESRKLKREQAQKAKDIRERQKRLMQDRQRNLQDHMNRY